MTEEIIAYFKALVEENPDVEGWWDWWPRHEDQLKAMLSPGEVLRLRHTPLKEIYDILERHGHVYPRPQDYIHSKFHYPLDVPTSWLQEPVRVEDVEKQIVRSELLMKEWKILKTTMSPDDEVWSFSSPTETWAHLMGRAGYALVRNGVPIDGIIIMMN